MSEDDRTITMKFSDFERLLEKSHRLGIAEAFLTVAPHLKYTIPKDNAKLAERLNRFVSEGV